MLRKLRPRSVYDVCAALALFVALGGTAYAVNTIGSDDVIDNSLTSADIQNLTLTTNDLGVGSVWGSRIKDSGVFSNHISNNSLTGDDIDESTLNNAGVVAPAQTTSSTASGADNVEVDVPLAFGSWTQLSGELDLIAPEITIDAPPTCQSGGGDGNVDVFIRLDGNLLTQFFRSIVSGDGTIKGTVTAIQPPNTSTPHTLTATVRDTCDGGENFNITSLKLSVAGIR